MLLKSSKFSVIGRALIVIAMGIVVASGPAQAKSWWHFAIETLEHAHHVGWLSWLSPKKPSLNALRDPPNCPPGFYHPSKSPLATYQLPAYQPDTCLKEK
jgi:hypothetical protein